MGGRISLNRNFLKRTVLNSCCFLIMFNNVLPHNRNHLWELYSICQKLIAPLVLDKWHENCVLESWCIFFTRSSHILVRVKLIFFCMVQDLEFVIMWKCMIWKSCKNTDPFVVYSSIHMCIIKVRIAVKKQVSLAVML